MTTEPGRSVARGGESIDESIEVRLAPPLTVRDDTAANHARVEAAVDRFSAAGLALPALEIVFHADRAPCRGHEGLFQPQFDPWRLLVCSDADFVLTHELAHAWEAATLDEFDRSAYVEHRGLATWSGNDTEWGERGVEDAAFIVQQNLMMRPVSVDTDRWRERIDAYERLTGNPSPIVVASR